MSTRQNNIIMVLTLCFILGCTTNRPMYSVGPYPAARFAVEDKRKSSEYVLDITIEQAFSNAIVIAKEVFPGSQVQNNGQIVTVVINEADELGVLTIEPIQIYCSTNASQSGVLYEMKEIKHGQLWTTPYLLKKYNKAYKNKYSDIRMRENYSPIIERKSVKLPVGVRIPLEGPKPNDYKRSSGLYVLDCSYENALMMAYEASQIAFPHDKIEVNYGHQLLINRKQQYYDFVFIVEPRIFINSLNSNDSGMLYQFSSKNSNTSRVYSPLMGDQRDFEEAFWRVAGKQVASLWMPQYRISYDQGVPDYIPNSIPKTYEGFKSYLDGRDGLMPFEGIWTEANGLYTLGIVYISNDPRFKYHAFVIESRQINWHPGEIKAKFSNLNNNKISTGEYRTGSKSMLGLSWDVQRDILKGLSQVSGQDVYFIKNYPSVSGDDLLTGIGTAWAVSKNGVFITAAHVVEGASKIYVGFREHNPKEVVVLALDQKLDLAVLKTKDVEVKYTPISVSRKTVANGETITVLGYPLPSKLGDDVKVTSGIISSQSGYQKDITTYQFSASVQPGNSGGPVVDKYGNVIGVVVSKLISGELVNYAVKSPYLIPLLDVVGITDVRPIIDQELTAQDIAERYLYSVYPVWIER